MLLNAERRSFRNEALAGQARRRSVGSRLIGCQQSGQLSFAERRRSVTTKEADRSTGRLKPDGSIDDGHSRIPVTAVAFSNPEDIAALLGRGP